MGTIVAVITTLITVLGSATAFKYYEKRMKLKHDSLFRKENEVREDRSLYRDDLKDRVLKLEALLKQAMEENKLAVQREIELSKLVASLETKVTYLQKHVDKLEEENKRLRT